MNNNNLMTLLDSIQKSESIDIKAGAALFHQNEDTHGIYYIEQGQLQLSRDTIDGHSVILFSAQSHEILAEASLFSEKYHCVAIALIDSKLRLYDKNVILEHLTNHPDFALQFIRLLATQVQKLRSLLELRGIKSPEQRFIQYLLLNLDENKSYAVPFSYKNLAIRLGMSHETLYRVLAKLEKQQLILRQDKKIIYQI